MNTSNEADTVKIIVTSAVVLGGKLRISGKVYGHPRFEGGTKVSTSSVQQFTTRNTRYEVLMEE